MARIRTIKPGFFQSLSNGSLSKTARLTYIGLWTYVDDAGRGVDDARLVKAALWPLDDDQTTKKVEGELATLAAAGKICRYEHDGNRYLHVVNWKRHQTINRPQPSLHPPCAFTDHSRNDHGTISESSRNGHVPITDDSRPEGNKEGKGSGRERNSARGPTDSGPPPPLVLVPDKPLAALAEREPPGFADFWEAWPRRIARQAALKAWSAALKRPDTGGPPAIMAGLERWVTYWRAASTAAEFIPYPATWLNQRRYLEDPGLPASSMPRGFNVLAEIRAERDAAG